eukprot:1155077-Pelagomonas_calceolata.AAC.6
MQKQVIMRRSARIRFHTRVPAMLVASRTTTGTGARLYTCKYQQTMLNHHHHHHHHHHHQAPPPPTTTKHHYHLPPPSTTTTTTTKHQSESTHCDTCAFCPNYRQGQVVLRRARSCSFVQRHAHWNTASRMHKWEGYYLRQCQQLGAATAGSALASTTNKENSNWARLLIYYKCGC